MTSKHYQEERESRQQVIEQIGAMIEYEGVMPWHKAWSGMSRPLSHISGKGYSLINSLLLGFRPDEFITFNQAKKEGGNIKKGAHGRPVCYWSTFTEKTPYKVDEDGTEHYRKIPFLKYYTVFSVEDTEGVERKFAPKTYETKPVEALEAIAKAYIEREGIRFETNRGNRACYSPVMDSITLPNMEQFEDAISYYSTLFHEMAHSTGAKNRLDRNLTEGSFGDEVYSAEELVAEITSSMLLAECGYSTPDAIRNSAAYVKHWKQFIHDDPRAFVSACGKAEKAINYILGRNQEEEDEAE